MFSCEFKRTEHRHDTSYNGKFAVTLNCQISNIIRSTQSQAFTMDAMVSCFYNLDLIYLFQLNSNFTRLMVFFFHQINSLNTEIVVFLQNLRKFAADQQVAIPDQKVVIGKRTVDLLYEIVSFIEEELMKKSDVIDVANEINPSFLNDLDQSHFELHRNIVCRLCNVNVNILSYLTLQLN